MSKTKIIWSIAGSLFLVGGVVAGVLLVLRNQDIRERAAPATSLYIVPGSQNKSPNDSFSLAVEMDTGLNQSVGFDLVINFNPQIFQVANITAGSAGSGFSVIKNSVDNTGGKILYSVFTTDSTKALNGSGLTVLNISATVKSGAADGTYNFTFDPSSAVAGLGEGQNVLMGKTPGSVVVAASAGPTTTPTPTSGSNATPTITPTPAPSATTTSTPFPIPVTGASTFTMVLGLVGIGALLVSLVATIF